MATVAFKSLRLLQSRANLHLGCGISVRQLSFSFLGPKKLEDVLKKELVEGKSATEVADLWYTYHEGKEDVVGLVLNGADGKSVLSRATKCPFFIQPIFRDDGFFNLVSQFQSPCHFLLAYLEDYKMDPHSASPLMTFSVFDDYADSKDVTLVRCDIFNKSIQIEEGRKVVQSLLDNYRKSEEFTSIKVFNERPAAFDVDDHISRMNKTWVDYSSANLTSIPKSP
mmetsp:Transcript_11241/g.14812  ORF Transcript_11241/g.14812 Transcript_11241/m.14812 type:complete len:225 (+) Transcript_11241:143-817(+)|eukprot:CAMPEP_0198136836 /NCGR_PEP_ID=MMETSP1443-20131203/416_1 /TAXON_ID=186043 /ORGANISM="Entomoneis sp., Strain CCMP2396" /LENGTH=224 /DNA_ID=CAMNT_0043798115 /DNA_START=121 /DNA_END=795 /DNA_ORIENTATION=+